MPSSYTLVWSTIVCSQREAELHSDKMRVEDMLYSILPRFVDRPHLSPMRMPSAYFMVFDFMPLLDTV